MIFRNVCAIKYANGAFICVEVKVTVNGLLLLSVIEKSSAECHVLFFCLIRRKINFLGNSATTAYINFGKWEFTRRIGGSR